MGDRGDYQDHLNLMHFRIYYDDDRVHDSAAGDRPPARGVQVILQDHPEVGAEIVTSSDYYVWENGRWKGVDQYGLYDFLLDSGIVLMGRMITREAYQQIVRSAAADKKTWLPSELKCNG